MSALTFPAVFVPFPRPNCTLARDYQEFYSIYVDGPDPESFTQSQTTLAASRVVSIDPSSKTSIFLVKMFGTLSLSSELNFEWPMHEKHLKTFKTTSLCNYVHTMYALQLSNTLVSSDNAGRADRHGNKFFFLFK
jgi:hypothetical protein